MLSCESSYFVIISVSTCVCYLFVCFCHSLSVIITVEISLFSSAKQLLKQDLVEMVTAVVVGN